MKSGRRHELATNELADWIANIPDWWRENSKIVITVIAMILVIGGIWYFTVVRTATARAEQGRQLSTMLHTVGNLKYHMALNPQSRADLSSQMILLSGQLKAFADVAANQNAAAFALIKSAEATRAAIHYSATMISAEAEARDLASARDSCLRAIGMIKDNPSLLASAKLQLGLCLEGMGKFDEAAAIYREILNDPQFAGDVAVAQATTRLAIMDDFRSPVLLAPPLAAQPAVMELAPAVEPTQPLVDVVEAGAAPEPNAGE